METRDTNKKDGASSDAAPKKSAQSDRASFLEKAAASLGKALETLDDQIRRPVIEQHNGQLKLTYDAIAQVVGHRLVSHLHGSETENKEPQNPLSAPLRSARNAGRCVAVLPFQDP